MLSASKRQSGSFRLQLVIEVMFSSVLLSLPALMLSALPRILFFLTSNSTPLKKEEFFSFDMRPRSASIAMVLVSTCTLPSRLIFSVSLL